MSVSLPAVPVKSVLFRVKSGTPVATLEVAVKDIQGLVLDPEDLLHAAFPIAGNELQPGKDSAWLFICNTNTNERAYYQMTPTVKGITARDLDKSKHKMKQKQKIPLRYDLYLNGEEDLLLDVEFQEPTNKAK